MRCGAICGVSSATGALKTRTLAEEQKDTEAAALFSEIAEKYVELLLKVGK